MNTDAIFLLAAIISFVFATIFMGVWVYQDAKQRDLPAGLWTLLVVFSGNFIGLILYLIMRKKEPQIICPYCGYSNDTNNIFCVKCGKELVEERALPEISIKTRKNWLIFALISVICCILSFGIFFFVNLNNEGFRFKNSYSSYRTNLSETIKQERQNASKNQWKLSFEEATQNYTFTQIYKTKKALTILKINIECQGSVKLVLNQKENTIETILEYGFFTIDMTSFHSGEIDIEIIQIDATQFSAQIEIE